MKKLLSITCLLLFAALSFAQDLNPVSWTYEAQKVGEHEYDLIFTAQVDAGWFVYSQFLDDNGPIPTTFNFTENEAVELIGKATEVGNKKEGYDAMFDMTLVKFSDKPIFTQRVRIAKKTTLTGYLEFMTCDDNRCLPPTQIDFRFTL